MIADVTTSAPDILFELGLAQALGKATLLISGQRADQHDLPSDLAARRIIWYDADRPRASDLSLHISRFLRDLKKFPRRSASLATFEFSPQFYVDWNLLAKHDFANLCHELLAQMGFQRVDWAKVSPEIDLVAELPRKDPDGYEYRELWLIGMDLGDRSLKLLEMFTMEPEFALHHLLRHSEELTRRLQHGGPSPVTILLISSEEPQGRREFRILEERMERRHKRELGANIRLRVWDRPYLTSLVQRFPQIGMKYFSDQGRSASSARKSYEQLYRENVDLVGRQAKLIEDLNQEKGRRIRAERDSVWRDISFSAAHKIGNPIFAVETDLDPLRRRIVEGRLGEAQEVIDNIRAAVEKAKGFIEQFKSLAKAQNVQPGRLELRPVLFDACRSLGNERKKCTVDVPDDVVVFGDAERLGECFDELVANASHWIPQKNGLIQITVMPNPPVPLPSFLEPGEYVLVSVADNGNGVPLEHKERIFDAFFTTYDHGTGLGLALVRRIVEGHGGAIIEAGVPGEGAKFHVYLPKPIEAV